MNALMAATVLLGEKTAVLNLHDDDSIVAAMMEPGATRIICDARYVTHRGVVLDSTSRREAKRGQSRTRWEK